MKENALYTRFYICTACGLTCLGVAFGGRFVDAAARGDALRLFFWGGALAAEALHLGTNFLATERSERCIVGDDFAVARYDDLWQRLN